MERGAAVDEPVGRAAAARHLARLEVGTAPLDDPLRYPGAAPACSYLLAGDRLEPVGERSLLDHGGDLGVRLAELGAAPMTARHPVLAYGSNRAPAQLRAKFRRAGLAAVVPVLRAEVRDLSVVFHATVTRYGAVPATVLPDAGARTEVFVTFLDTDQAAVVDRTEPGQERPALDPGRHPVRLRSGEPLAGVGCYRAVRPVLLIAGQPCRLVEVASTGSGWPAATQVEVQARLAARWPGRVGPYGTPEAFVAAVARDVTVATRATASLRELVDEPDGELAARLPA